MRFVFRSVLVLAVILAAFVGGFLVQRFDIGPMTDWAFRVERKIGKMTGQPSLTQQAVDLVESTFVRLRGTVYEIPDNHYIRGGGLTVWGEDLIIVDRLGRLYILYEGEGISRLWQAGVPDNGLAAYEAEIAAGVWDGYSNKPHTIRYNDIQYIDTGVLRGLALSYTFYDPARRCYGNRVAWLPVDTGIADVAALQSAAQDWQILFESKPCLDPNPTWTAIDGLMAGGRMAFEAPSTLYLGNGEFHLDGVHTYDVGAQDDTVDYGKVIAIDLAGGGSRHVSKGHRNLQGMAIDTAGRLWATEHGIRGGDELNLIREGAAYGWPEVTLGTLYSGQPFPSRGAPGQHDFQTKPVFAWLPSAAISSLMAIDGFDPAWDGNLLAGSLSSSEFGRSLFNIKIEGERVLYVERIEIGRRIRYLTQWGADRIAVWLDTNELVIFRAEERPDPLGSTLDQLAAKWPDEVENQTRIVMAKCAECHSFEPRQNRSAPSLNGVWSREIAGAVFDYSDALSARGGSWSPGALRDYLSAPGTFAPGTSMPDQGLEDGPVLDAVLEVLENVDTSGTPDLRYN